MIGRTISHYRILEKLGEGGMGVVYKAKDTKLERTVALKFLSLTSIGDEEKKRFKREAKAAASLNHPNIATIHAIDEADDQTFIAMEYIEGQSLQEIVGANGGKPMPIDKAIDYATQTAAGLQAAHEKGITHRDIKSANIMVTDKGQIKIMDFGLAKLANRSMMTKVGTTLGTTSYMSPEQARGEEVDHRADIWSLGVVLYEMISGQLPFKGDYDSAVVYSILHEEPEPLTALRTGVPISLDGIIAKALAKEADTRYQHVDELPVDLKGLDSSSISKSRISARANSGQANIRTTHQNRVLGLVTTFMLGLILAGFAVWVMLRGGPTAPKPVKKVAVTLPANGELALPGAGRDAFSSGVAISPDGGQLVYVASDGKSRKLYLRKMEEFNTTPLTGTDGAGCPFFSPDGQWVGFCADGKLKKVLLAGGKPIDICEVGTGFGGAAWGIDNNIILGSLGSGLMQVSASGGPPQPLTTPVGDASHRWPEILPDGKAVLFTIWPFRGNTFPSYKRAHVAIFSLKTKDWHTIVEGGSSPRYAATGHIVYVRLAGFMAVPFDISQHKLTASPIPVLGDVVKHRDGFANFDISSEGSLAYILPGADLFPPQTLMWVDRTGKQLSKVLTRGGAYTPRISPDGRRIAFIAHSDDGDVNIWIYDIAKGKSTPLTYKGWNNAPVWDREGKRVTYNSVRDGTWKLYWKAADGSSEEEVLWHKQPHLSPGSWSLDGKHLVFYQTNEGTFRDIGVLSLEDSSKSVFVATEANEISPKFSPDGKWVAYGSNETGRYEVYVQPYPVTGARYPISNDGGSQPVWAPDGRELFYRNGGKMMVVTVETNPVFKGGTPRKLFEGYLGNKVNNNFRAEYDIHPDGDRFLMIEQEEEKRINHINVVLNWFEELKRLKVSGGEK